MERIFASTPIDRMSARVTGQSGCKHNLSSEQLRENLVLRWKRLNAQVIQHPKHSPIRKKLGAELKIVSDEIHRIRPSKKAQGVDKYFIDAARETLPKHSFNTVMDKAVKRLREAEKSQGFKTSKKFPKLKGMLDIN